MLDVVNYSRTPFQSHFLQFPSVHERHQAITYRRARSAHNVSRITSPERARASSSHHISAGEERTTSLLRRITSPERARASSSHRISAGEERAQPSHIGGRGARTTSLLRRITSLLRRISHRAITYRRAKSAHDPVL